MTFFDAAGAAVAYTDDDTHIFSFNGQPLGYISGPNVYAFDGGHLGTFGDGWLRDHAGGAALFTDRASGGPVLPVRGVEPVRGVKAVMPVRGVQAVPPVPAVRSLGWSAAPNLRYFRR